MQFQYTIIIAASPKTVWDFLWDVERLARCIPGCEQASTVEPHERYKALIVDRVGPLKVKMPLDLVVESAEEQQRLHVVANGKDSTLGSTVRIDIHADLTPHDAATSLGFQIDVAVSGKIAGLGAALFKRKFDDIMSKFGQQVKAEIEGTPAAVGQS